jgi:uridine kinase
MQQPYLIGITGGSGSGKTSLVAALRERFSIADLCIVSMDDYYLPNALLPVDANGELHFDLPDSFDKKLFRTHLQQLLRGVAVEKKEHVFNNPAKQARVLTLSPAPVILVEGLFIFHYKKIAPLFDLKVFVSVKENLKVIRRIHRDQVERGYPVDDVLYKYQHHVLPSFERYILPYRDEADIIINNNRNFNSALDVLVSFIQWKVGPSSVL